VVVVLYIDENRCDRKSKEEGKKERDVLFVMVATLFVSHFERSPLNAEAERNAIKKISNERVH
jgi:hypothetical protein